MEFCRTLAGIDQEKIAIAARDDMSVVALYAALMDGNCESIILKNPPETQDLASDPYGKGAATEMLNCLRITDVYQIPALLVPSRIQFAGKMPQAYQWSLDLITKLGKQPFIIIP
jgi:hypothetical protein